MIASEITAVVLVELFFFTARIKKRKVRIVVKMNSNEIWKGKLLSMIVSLYTKVFSVMLIVNCQYRIAGIQSLLGTIHVQSVAL